MARKTRPRPRAYVDTSALIAYLDRSDTYHPLFRRLFADPPDLVSTALVVGEGQAWFLKRYDRMRALQFVSFFEELRLCRSWRSAAMSCLVAQRSCAGSRTRT